MDLTATIAPRYRRLTCADHSDQHRQRRRAKRRRQHADQQPHRPMANHYGRQRRPGLIGPRPCSTSQFLCRRKYVWRHSRPRGPRSGFDVESPFSSALGQTPPRPPAVPVRGRAQNGSDPASHGQQCPCERSAVHIAAPGILKHRTGAARGRQRRLATILATMLLLAAIALSPLQVRKQRRGDGARGISPGP